MLRLPVSTSMELEISLFQHYKHQALKSPVTIEHVGSCWFMTRKRMCKFTQRFCNLSLLWLDES